MGIKIKWQVGSVMHQEILEAWSVLPLDYWLTAYTIATSFLTMPAKYLPLKTGVPCEIRTHVTRLKTWGPGPLDERDGTWVVFTR